MRRGSVRRSGHWLALCLVAAACAGHQDAGAAGADCYRDADCKSGLVCVPNGASARVCSSDTTSLVSQVEGPPAPPVPEDAGTEIEDAAPPVDDPDAGVVEPTDAGADPADAAPEDPADAAADPADAAPEDPMDPADAGTPGEPDAG